MNILRAGANARVNARANARVNAKVKAVKGYSVSLSPRPTVG